MTSLTIDSDLTPGEAAALVEPLDNTLVAEELVDVEETAGSRRFRFRAVDGPLDQWDRTVTLEAGAEPDDPVTTSTSINFKLALPYFGWLFRGVVVRQLRKGAIASSDERVPWWSPPDRLDARSARTLAAAAALAAVTGYLGGLLTQSLTFVAGDLGGDTQDQSFILAIARIGALVTFFATALADRRGRKPLIAGGLVIASLAAASAALAPALPYFGASQTLTRGMVATVAILLPIAATEEMPAGSRAFGVALVTMSGGLGVGLVLLTMSLANELTGDALWSWRVPHVLALLALPVALRVLRQFSETRRFEALEAATHDTGGPTSDEHHVRLARLVLLALLGMTVAAFVAPVAQLQNDYLRTERGFDPTLVAVFIASTNVWGGIGVVVGGRMADRVSRHRVATVGLIGLALGNAVLFSVSGWGMWLASSLGALVGAALVPTLGVMNPEMFPTARRGFANGLLNLIAVVGSVTGLLVAGWAIDQHGYGATMRVMALLPLIAILFLRGLPETARRELEEINP
jgi:MFS family permease